MGRARKGICLDTDLHVVFLMTPPNVSIMPSWQTFDAMYEQANSTWRAVADAVGITHSFIKKKALGQVPQPRGVSDPLVKQLAQNCNRMEILHSDFGVHWFCMN